MDFNLDPEEEEGLDSNEASWGVNQQHSREKSNKCNQCDYISSQAGNLKRHMQTHYGEKFNKCNQCNFASSRTDILRRHLKIHIGEKSHKCNQGEYKSSHLKIHSGEK